MGYHFPHIQVAAIRNVLHANYQHDFDEALSGLEKKIGNADALSVGNYAFTITLNSGIFMFLLSPFAFEKENLQLSRHTRFCGSA
jgi:hypothetical protein